MPDENQHPNPQPIQSDSPAIDPQVIHPKNIDAVGPSSPEPESRYLVSPQFTQPTAMVNGQAYQPTTTLSSSQHEQLSDKKPSKWRYLFIILGVLQVAGIGLFLLVMLWAVQLAKSGQSGTEFIALILFVTVVPVVAVISLINLIGLPIYLRKHKPHRKGLNFSIVSLVISFILVLYGMYTFYGLVVYPKKLSKELDQKNEQRQQEFETANANPEITKEEAIELLKSCKLKGFYYTNQTDKSNPANGGWGELSSTGVVLTKIDGQPYRISIADKLIPELVPIAREAQKTCGGPQFWHDGTYEQSMDRKLNNVVNTTLSGRTKEETINYMQSCKADYLVGYTDINLIMDVNTKSWLNRVEQSSNGIEISEGSKTYVFASKAMTTALLDNARQSRQSCYSTKKLYIQIDNWTETEYPAGKWTRVKL